jgi:uncharacterized protein
MKNVVCMKPNPGGMLNLAEIVGRDSLVADLISTVEQQSIVLVAERRTGKTHVLEKFKATAPTNWVVIKRDIGAIRTAAEFVQHVMADLYPHLAGKQNFKNWLDNMTKQLGGTQLGPIKLPNFEAKNWKQVLAETIEHLNENKDVAKVVFLWDELPWMLEIITKNNAAEAMELLDTLRALRQQSASKLRMIFTGSLGLHHVIRQLKVHGYNNTPTNDMLTVEVEPLAEQDAIDLCKRLIDGSKLEPETPELYGHLAKEVDRIPFYIHHVVATLAKDPAKKDIALSQLAIDAVITKGIQSSNNPWDLEHYEERTRAYYGTQRAECLALLDVIAASEEPIVAGDVTKRTKITFDSTAPQDWLEMLRLLERDHYITRNDAGHYFFKFKVVRRWWLWHRNLTIVSTQ